MNSHMLVVTEDVTIHDRIHASDQTSAFETVGNSIPLSLWSSAPRTMQVQRHAEPQKSMENSLNRVGIHLPHPDKEPLCVLQDVPDGCSLTNSIKLPKQAIL